MSPQNTGSRASGTPIRQLGVSSELVGLYCERHELNELEPFMLQKLGLAE